MSAADHAAPDGTETVDLTRLFWPTRMAVVGAHDRKAPFDFMYRQLSRRVEAIGGEIIPVNPKLDTVGGVRAYPELATVPGELDVVVILIADVLGTMRQVVQKRPRFVVVHASGFAEGGSAEGRKAEEELLSLARAAGARLVGPNTNTNMFELLDDTLPRRFGLATQSGHQGRPLAAAQELGFGLSYWVTTGNEVDLGVPDFVDHMARDPETHAIAGYVEGFRSGAALRRAAASCIRERTPLVLVKVGVSGKGATAALSHTGQLAGSDAVLDAFFEQNAIHRVHDLDELLDVTTVLARATALPPVDGIGILSVSGGTNAHLVDLLETAGLPVPALSARTQERLRALLPAPLAVTNPVDNGGYSLLRGAGPELADIVLDDPAVGMLLLPVSTPLPAMAQPLIDMALHAHARGDKPVIALALMPSTDDPVYRAVVEAGVPVVRNMRDAVSAARALLNHPARLFPGGATPPVDPAALVPRRRGEVLDEERSLAWLAGRGLEPVPYELVGPDDDPVPAAERLGFPVVLKAVADGLVHKSERGAVQVGLRDAAELRTAQSRMRASLTDVPLRGFLVATQLGGGVELLVGISTDPLLGPVVMVGAGGTAAEALQDNTLSVLPFDETRARAMVERLRVSRLLGPWRGRPRLDVDAVVRALGALRRIAESGEVVELDVNPLLVREEGAVMLDAVVVLTQTNGAETEGSGE